VKRLMVTVLITLFAAVAFSDWLVEVKVEGMEYIHDQPLELALLLETIENDLATYDATENYLWITPDTPQGSYQAELFDHLQDLVCSLVHREPYHFVGIYTRNHANGNTILPVVYGEKRMTPPDPNGVPESLLQKTFSLSADRSILAKAYNEGQGYFTTDIKRVMDATVVSGDVRDFQKQIGVRGYFAYPLKNGDYTIGLLVIATTEPGITEDQFFRIKQYGDAATWLVVQTVDLLAHPEKLAY